MGGVYHHYNMNNARGNARRGGRGGRGRGRARGGGRRHPNDLVMLSLAQGMQALQGQVDALREVREEHPEAQGPPDVVIDVQEDGPEGEEKGPEVLNAQVLHHEDVLSEYTPICVLTAPRSVIFRPIIIIAVLVCLLSHYYSPTLWTALGTVPRVAALFMLQRLSVQLWSTARMRDWCYPPAMALPQGGDADSAIKDIEKYPCRWLTTNLWQRILMMIDQYLQRSAVDDGYRSYIETGRLVEVSRFLTEVSASDTRLAYQQPNQLVKGRIVIVISTVDSMVDNSRTCLLWSPEQMNNALVKLYRLDAEERAKQHYEATARVTNLLIHGKHFFDTTHGSGIVALLKAVSRDIQSHHALKTVNLNPVGTQSVGRMVLGTVWMTLWVCLLSVIIMQGFVSSLRLLSHAGEHAFSAASGQA